MFGGKASGSDCFSLDQKDWLNENYISKDCIVTCRECGVLFEDRFAQVLRHGYSSDTEYHYCVHHQQKYSPSWEHWYERARDDLNNPCWKKLPKEPKEDPCAEILGKDDDKPAKKTTKKRRKSSK